MFNLYDAPTSTANLVSTSSATQADLIGLSNPSHFNMTQSKALWLLYKKQLQAAIKAKDENGIYASLAKFKIFIGSITFPFSNPIHGLELFMEIMSNMDLTQLSPEILSAILQTLRPYLILELIATNNEPIIEVKQHIYHILHTIKTQVGQGNDRLLAELNFLQMLSELYVSIDFRKLRQYIFPLIAENVDLRLYTTAINNLKTLGLRSSPTKSADSLINILTVYALYYKAAHDTSHVQFMLQILKKANNDWELTACTAELLAIIVAKTPVQAITKLALNGDKNNPGLLNLLHYYPSFFSTDRYHCLVRKQVCESLLVIKEDLRFDEQKQTIDKALSAYSSKEKNAAIKQILASNFKSASVSLTQSVGIATKLTYEFSNQLDYDEIQALLSLYNEIDSPQKLLAKLISVVASSALTQNEMVQLVVAAANIKDEKVLNYFLGSLLQRLAQDSKANSFRLANVILDTLIIPNIANQELNIVTADDYVDSQTVSLAQTIVQLAWQSDNIEILSKIFNLIDADYAYTILYKKLLAKLCLDAGSDKVWSVLLNNNLLNSGLLIPELFPVQLPEAINFIVTHTGIKADWINQLQQYRHLHSLDYCSCIRGIAQHPVFSDKIQILLAQLISSSWEYAGKSHHFILQIENLYQAYGQEIELFLEKINETNKRERQSTSFLTEVIKDILNVDQLKTDEFSTKAEILNILTDIPMSDWNEHLSNLSMRVFTKKYPEKDINIVMDDFNSMQYKLGQQELELVRDKYQAIMLYFMSKEIYKLDKQELTQQIKQLTASRATTQDFLIQYLALARQAVYLTKGYYPYNTQLFVTLAFLTHEKGKGYLAQVKTGQGKSIIVATIAAYFGIQGKYVDVITTSENLAARDAHEMREFFNMFNLNTSHSGIDNQSQSSYAAEITYGTPFSLEFGYLRGQYNNDNVRGKRRYDIAIIDEVDSLLVDQSSRTTRLINAKDIFARTAWIYPLLMQLNQDDPMLTANSVLAKLEMQPAYQNSSRYIKQFIEDNIAYWLEATREAVSYEQDIAYTMRGESVTPVDYKHTGELQERTYYCRGLHQALEVKHGLYPSIERVLSCQVSHLNFFNFYQAVYGLSGTLGGDFERQEIKDFYDIDTFDVPVHQKGLLREQTFKLEPDDNSWFQEIVREAEQMAEQQRCVLILLETIRDTQDIYSLFKKNSALLLNGRQKLSVEEVLSMAGRPGMITVATNIAGRGTDIKPADEVENQGGMHVIMAFYPLNQRVEDQAIGRTARQGRQGSYSFILNAKREKIPAVLKEIDDIKLFLKRSREENELQCATQRKEVYAPLTLALDNILAQFSKFKKEFCQGRQAHEIEALDTNWIYWFYQQANQVMNIEQGKGTLTAQDFVQALQGKFNEFIKKTQANDKKDNLLEHPESFLERANYHAGQKQYDKAVADCIQVINMDSGCSEAYFTLGTVYEQIPNRAEFARDMFKKTISVAEQNVEYCPGYFKDWVIIAASHGKLGAREQEQQWLVCCELLFNQTTDPLKLESIAIALNKYKYFDLVEKLLRSALERNPEHELLSQQLAVSYLNRGFELGNAKQYEKAIAMTKLALQLNPNYTLTYSNLGYYHMQLKQYKEAKHFLEQGLKIDPEHQLVKRNLAVLADAFISQGHEEGNAKLYEKAIATTKLALQVNSRSEVAYNNIGYYHMQLKQYSEAERALIESLKINPNYQLAKTNLASLYITLGQEQAAAKQYGKAMATVKLAIRYNPQSAVAYNNLGYYHMELKQYFEAERALKESLRIDPNYQLARTNLNHCNWHINKSSSQTNTTRQFRF